MTAVTLIGPPESNGGVGQYTSDFADAINEHIRIRRFDVGLNPLSHLRLAVAAAQDDTEAVHVQFVYSFLGPAGAFSLLFFPLLYLFTRIESKQVVLTLHEVWDESDTNSLSKRLYAGFIHTLLSICSDEVTFLSENAEESFHQYGWIGETHVISHGVNSGATRRIDDARERFGFNEDDVVISQHGYVNPRKGIETFFEIAGELPQYEFLLAGGPRTEEHEEYFMELCASAPENVTITGVLEEEGFHAAFNATDLVVLPYEDINQSGIFNWCAAYDIPTIASEIPYFKTIQSRWGCPKTFPRESVGEAVELTQRLSQNGLERSQLVDSMATYRAENSTGEVFEWFEDGIYSKQ